MTLKEFKEITKDMPEDAPIKIIINPQEGRALINSLYYIVVNNFIVNNLSTDVIMIENITEETCY